MLKSFMARFGDAAVGVQVQVSVSEGASGSNPWSLSALGKLSQSLVLPTLSGCSSRLMDGVVLGPDELWGLWERPWEGWQVEQSQNQEQISKLTPDTAMASSPSELFYTSLSITTISPQPHGEGIFPLKGKFQKGIQAFSSKAK